MKRDEIPDNWAAMVIWTVAGILLLIVVTAIVTGCGLVVFVPANGPVPEGLPPRLLFSPGEACLDCGATHWLYVNFETWDFEMEWE